MRPYEHDNYFLDIYHNIKDFACMDIDCLWNIKELCNYKSSNVKGDIIEVGVFKGASAIILLNYSNNQKIYLYETFQGLQDVDETIDKSKNRDFTVSINEIQRLCTDNVTLIKGYFPFSSYDHNQICFAHLDCDTYKSTKNSIEFIYPRLSNGGIILIHDYMYDGTPGIEKAINEFNTETGLTGIAFPFNQYMYIKE